ncbi:hypothetical protein PJF56_15020 [Roseofilum sp. BLCC_M91]|uniref:Glycosyl transferase family 8 n=1 Tax=Roseofilum halophilum BLCC-M91 TaxID=3022259 RepID=A0ABT7BLX4_9CYAN|nr:hypothetical protein [Roseofilum halophilum]MDJ1180176.1 hypothetical protein [Roseofilum halophilum BLCC-M91]
MHPNLTEKQPQSYAFVFVCQQGEIEGMALLLAASLKRFIQCEYELIAAIPTPFEKWGIPQPRTFALLEKMGVRIVYFENHILGNTLGDPLTNKIYCLQIPTKMDKLIFLDSDMLCLRNFYGDERFAVPVNVASTFRATGRNWEAIYGAVNLSVPTREIETLFSGEMQPPYFNSGFIAVEAQLAPILYQEWLKCFHQINASGAMKDNPYFREQVSLAVTIIKMGLEYDLLDEGYNFWVKARPLDPNSLPYFLHHTWPYPTLYEQPILEETIRSLLAEYPGMAKLVALSRWRYYFQPKWLVSVQQTLLEINRKRFKQFFDPFLRDLGLALFD